MTRNGKNGDSPLHLARVAALGDEETAVSFLPEKGALPNALDGEDRAPLHVAAEKGELAAVNALLLAATADTAGLLRGEDEDTALDLAASQQEGCVRIVEALIQGGADVNAADPNSGSTALHDAAYMGEAGVIDVLVRGGANVNAAKEESGWMPLHCAADGNCVEAMAALVRPWLLS